MAGLALIVTAFHGSAFAGPGPQTPVPAIDPGSIASALTLLTGGVMMMTERRRAK